MDRRRVALLLAVVGALCLPAPLYLGWAADATAPPAQSSQIYAAEPVDLGTISDQKQFVDAHGSEVTFSAHQASERYSAGEYRSPNVTRAALKTAMREGSVTVDDAGARADLREIAADDEFVRDAYGDIAGYYRLSVEENGSLVRAENGSLDVVANATAEQAPRYEELSAGEQRTIDRIIDNSSGNDLGYRPLVNEPFVDQLPTPVWRGETLYSISVYGHVDDFGPGLGGFVAGIAVAAVGLVLLFLAAVVYLSERRTDSAGG
ncbi:hypothetical protein [Halolamina salifodinae]|uniref:Uncharacterized protein n=1 Tax=Halolamina salifodinae TaxID=1202767 RepID=A0A8T4GZD7_9EURY|nr:hypothetical protein [Halolamina salifodinae]MBP1988351.1 hypothetical protein [Halolamina salifodinae]